MCRSCFPVSGRHHVSHRARGRIRCGSAENKAVPQADGTYRITGRKCFITNGDQDITEQIVYPVLARIEGTRRARKGFLCLSFPNTLCARTALSANATTCTAPASRKDGRSRLRHLLHVIRRRRPVHRLSPGRAGRGMNIMFHMLNETRLEVGIMALGGSSAAYNQAVEYARTRLQGLT